MASNVNKRCLMSDYFASLETSAKARYLEKVKECGFDPYLLKPSEFNEDLASLPAIEYPDIVNYLVLQTSWLTKSQMKAYKSLEAYNFFISGWVGSLLTKEVSENKVLVFARVNHSQRARETPLKTWLVAEKSGDVELGHCNCMAGLGEACSHVGAVLFACEAAVRMLKSVTCTQESNKWLPTHIKKIPYLPVSSVDFRSAKRKYYQLGEEEKENSPPCFKRQNNVAPPTKQEQLHFLQAIANSKIKPAVLSVTSPYNKSFRPKEMDMPSPLPALYNEQCTGLKYFELLEHCSDISISVTESQCQTVERQTRKQASTRIWFEQRSGRITASKLKAACHTDPNRPSKSLVKAICYPEAHKISTEATRWGCTNETIARDKYEKIIANSHERFTVSDSGLNINPRWPQLGASPDGFVSCDCCGKGVCEIKCPHGFKDQTLLMASGQKKFCLIKNGNSICLDKTHEYYYQVQAQIFISDVEYCDFVVWTEKDLHIERIVPDSEFWEEALLKATKLFNVAVLPELVGRWFTRPTTLCDQETMQNGVEDVESDEDEGPWCYCQQHLDRSKLIGCDNDKCKIVWFHMDCLKIVHPPKGEWYCPSCSN